jgi:hypothetical protein
LVASFSGIAVHRNRHLSHGSETMRGVMLFGCRALLPLRKKKNVSDTCKVARLLKLGPTPQSEYFCCEWKIYSKHVSDFFFTPAVQRSHVQTTFKFVLSFAGSPSLNPRPPPKVASTSAPSAAAAAAAAAVRKPLMQSSAFV